MANHDAAEAGPAWTYENGFTRWVEGLQGTLTPEEEAAARDALRAAYAEAAERGEEYIPPGRGFWGSIWDGLLWFIGNLMEAAYNILYAVTHPGMWLDWSKPEAVARFIYYGGSVEFFFVVLLIVFVLTGIGMARRGFMWGMVRGLEWIANNVGRLFAWAGLIMVLQQIIVVFMQRIFLTAQISIGFGKSVTYDISWWAEGLKFHNALVVTLCLTYTFVQGGHVRVDLIYAAVRHRTKKVIDMVGSVLFMMPFAVMTWWLCWYFMWRHLSSPPTNAFNSLERTRFLNWKVETIGFSPNGFNAYFLFKVLMVLMAGMIFLQAVAFFYRSYLEWREGEESTNKYLDKDRLNDSTADAAAAAH